MYRMFEFDITEFASPGGVNTLAVEVLPPTQNDLSLTFVDWNPMPPDKDMGLVRDVYVLMSGPVAVRHPQALTDLAPSLDSAGLTLAADLRNASGREIEGTLKATIGNISVSRSVKLGPHQNLSTALTPADYPQLTIHNPKLWWPYPLGPQNLYRARLEFIVGGQVSDVQEFDFGIRRVTSELDAQKHRLFQINGQKILIRGGGWTQDMMLRFSPAREDDELRYVRDMHLNTIRLEGKLMNDHFYEACDRQGILVMAGWCCCSYWERWRNWKPEDYTIAGESLRDQLRRIRNHPSVLAFLYGSDNSPVPDAEKVYLKVLEEERWPDPYISSAADRTTPGAGRNRRQNDRPVRLRGAQLLAAGSRHASRRRGRAVRPARGRTSQPPRAAPACLGQAALSASTPKPAPARPSRSWPACGRCCPRSTSGPSTSSGISTPAAASFAPSRLFTTALENRYGKAKDLEDYVRKSQVMAYEGERAMFEAYGRNKYAATGVVQWMLNNAWPSIIWHLYD